MINHKSTRVGQVWEDAKGNRRQIVSILAGARDEWPVQSWDDVPGDPDSTTGKIYSVVWTRESYLKPKTAFSVSWESWVNHARLIEETE